MTGLSKITDKILADARADAAERLRAADAECERIKKEALEASARLRADSDAAARREAEEILTRARSGEATISRDTVLDAKGRSVERAFALAKKSILELPPEEYSSLLLSMLNSALAAKAEDERICAENGDSEGDTSADICEVILNSKDRERYGKALIKGATSKVTLSPDSASIDGGLILKYGNIEINCSVETVIEQLRPSLEARVYRALFPEYAQKR